MLSFPSLLGEETAIGSENNIDRLLKARAEIDEQLRKHKSQLSPTPATSPDDQVTLDAVSPPSSAAAPRVAAALSDRYEILQELGKGGMGVVYKARDRETGEVVALKVIRPDIAADPVTMERFKNELRLARKITHRNVCRTHEFHRTPDGMAYISMEFVKGDSLRAILKRFGGLGFRKATEIALEICAGLREAHREGVVHRDLKPENVMLTEAGEVKVMDFGIARSVETGTLTGTITGTPAYMSPEQAAGKPVDQRADIYALGLVLYELYTGEQAMRAETPVAVVMMQIHETPPPPGKVEPALPADIEKAILKCLVKDPAKRFQSVDELEAALTQKAPEPAAEPAAGVQAAPLPLHLTYWQRQDNYLLGVGLLGALVFFSLFARVYPYSGQALRISEQSAVAKAVAIFQKFQPEVTNSGAKATLRVREAWSYPERVLTLGLGTANRPPSPGSPGSKLAWSVVLNAGSQRTGHVGLNSAGQLAGISMPSKGPTARASPPSPESLLPGAVRLVRELFGQDVSKLAPEIAGFKNPAFNYAGSLKWNLPPTPLGEVSSIRLDYHGEDLANAYLFDESRGSPLFARAPDRLHGYEFSFILAIFGIELVSLLMVVLFFARHLHRETRRTAALTALFAVLALGGVIYHLIRGTLTEGLGFTLSGFAAGAVIWFLVAYAVLAVTEYYLGSSLPSRAAAWFGLLRDPFHTQSVGLGILRGITFGALYLGLHAVVLLLLGTFKLAGPNIQWLGLLEPPSPDNPVPSLFTFSLAIFSLTILAPLLAASCLLAFPVGLATRFSQRLAVFLIVPATLWLIFAVNLPGASVFPLLPQFVLGGLQGLCLGWLLYRYDLLTALTVIFTVSTWMLVYPLVTIFREAEPFVTTLLLPWFLFLLAGLTIYFWPQWQAARKRVAAALQ